MKMIVFSRLDLFFIAIVREALPRPSRLASSIQFSLIQTCRTQCPFYGPLSDRDHHATVLIVIILLDICEGMNFVNKVEIRAFSLVAKLPA
ncbi:hypothetical protein ABKN59_008329 [Abortiporus biennis]